MFGSRRFETADFQIVGVFDVLPGRLPALLNHSRAIEILPEDQLREVDHRIGAALAAKRRRSANRTKMIRRSLESCLHPADQAC